MTFQFLLISFFFSWLLMILLFTFIYYLYFYLSLIWFINFLFFYIFVFASMPALFLLAIVSYYLFTFLVWAKVALVGFLVWNLIISTSGKDHLILRDRYLSDIIVLFYDTFMTLSSKFLFWAFICSVSFGRYLKFKFNLVRKSAF